MARKTRASFTFLPFKKEKERIEEVLKETYCNKSAAAKLLGISRVSLYSKIKQYKITERIK
ncbi:helix-turn-helix domain-containing protein [Neobacillus sp. GCM10023253]|uniref:helix-turn-helix domain-containing protein n=1 Tax=Neobacillus sp. GCM10023253 TaxID=3252644 RepID=UPI0036241B42